MEVRIRINVRMIVLESILRWWFMIRPGIFIQNTQNLFFELREGYKRIIKFQYFMDKAGLWMSITCL